ncbi:1,3-beta-D-glucan synthase, partial [Paramarasmius palmivorus]
MARSTIDPMIELGSLNTDSEDSGNLTLELNMPPPATYEKCLTQPEIQNLLVYYISSFQPGSPSKPLSERIGISVPALLKFLADRLPELGEYDGHKAATTIHLFKMAFGAVAAHHASNEPILASLLCALLGAIGGGGRFEANSSDSHSRPHNYRIVQNVEDPLPIHHPLHPSRSHSGLHTIDRNVKEFALCLALDKVRPLSKINSHDVYPAWSSPHEKSLSTAMEPWYQATNNMSQYDHLHQIALYLLCWGEAAQVHFVPECLCFIFKCADDYYQSPECQNRVEPVPEGLYLRAVIKPLYRFIRDQGYEVQDGKFVQRERDHDQIIGYDDVNQLFWYPEGIARIVLNDKTRLVDLPPAQRFMKFDRIDWNRAFFKTYYEKRSFGHLLVNFNRIWVIHISMYWFYTAYNSPAVYAVNGQSTPAMTWSVTALGGAVATFIMILATLMEFSYIPTTWNNTSHLTRRLLFLLVTLGLTCGPTVYVAIVVRNGDDGQLALILGIVQFFISVVATLLFAIML